MSNKKRTPFKKAQLDTSNQIFSEVMANGRKYIIPQFQRDYSWTTDHWDELWQDIEQLRKDRTQHFMGYLVFQTQDTKTFDVIDGQQRITTLSILIVAAIKRLNAFIAQEIEVEANKERVAIYKRTYLGIHDPITLTTDPKLILNRHNDRHFQDLTKQCGITVQRGITATNRSINNAFKFFEKKFEDCQSGEHVAEILADIADGLFFSIITVQDELNAYTVFETLNARGVRLSTPDLLKNYLLSTMANGEAYAEEHFRDFETQWAVILEQLGETEFTNFLRSYRGMCKKLVTKKELFRTLKTDVRSSTEVLPYLQDLKRYAPVYASLQNRHDDFWKEDDGRYTKVCEHLETLTLFNIKTPLSLLMAGFERLPPKDFITLIERIVAVSIRYNVICGKSPNQQEMLYNTMANTLMVNRPSLHDLTNLLTPVYPVNNEFQSAFISKTMPSRQSSKKIIFLLRKIEQHLSGDVSPLSLTLEHVLPFNPDDEWQEYFGREHVEQGIDRLGNMALLPSSQNMGQESFKEKRETLKESSRKINQNIARYSEWDMDSVQDHQKWLAKQAKAIWQISQLEQPPRPPTKHNNKA